MVEDWQRKDIKHRQKIARTCSRSLTHQANHFPGKIYNGDFLSLGLKRSPDGYVRQIIVKLNTYMEEREVVQRLEKAFADVE